MDLVKMQPVWFETGISQAVDVAVVRRMAEDAARRLSFSDVRRDEAMLVASELAQNHLGHHTKGGLVRISGMVINGAPCLTIASLDEGPGIPDVDEALKDGFSTSGGLGMGLGTVKRLADRFFICSGRVGTSPCPDLGPYASFSTVVTALLRDREEQAYPSVDSLPRFCIPGRGLDLAALIRPYSGQTYSGDGMFCQDDGRFCRICLVDATGHGRPAAEVSCMVMDTLAGLSLNLGLDEVLRALGASLAGSAGASIYIVLLDRDLCEVRTAGVGNVACIFYLDGDRRGAVCQPGVLGNGHLTYERCETYGFSSRVLCFMHSDGVKPPMDLSPGLALQPFPSDVWGQIFFRPDPSIEDDASLVVWQWQNTAVRNIKK